MNRIKGEKNEGLKEEGKCQLTCMPRELLNGTHHLSPIHTHTQKHTWSVATNGFQIDVATDIMQEVNEI